MPISNIYEIGKRSLLAYQSAIHTTSGNISNVNNENYSRRRVDLSQLIIGFSSLGLSQDQNIRMRQQYAQSQIWQENQSLNEYETSGMLLKQVENIFAEDTDSGLSSLLNQFWNAWNDLANDPESEYARAIVRDKGVLIANSFQRMNSEFRNMQDQIRPQVTGLVQDINQMTTQIADINQRLKIEQSPDLLDRRDELISDLSSMIDIKIKEKENGQVNIFADGYLLVGDEYAFNIQAEVENTDGEDKINIHYLESDKTINVGSGQLKGLLDVHNRKIPEYLEKLDALAMQLAGDVNTIHRSGHNLNGTSDIPFFDDSISGAADFNVNEAIVQNSSLIASRLPTESEGSGSVAQSISDLRFQKTMSGVSIDEYYHTMLADIGNKIYESDFMEQSQRNIVLQLQNQKDSITGVSLDEEMTRLVQFQQAYQAAARIVNTVDEMVDTVLAMG